MSSLLEPSDPSVENKESKLAGLLLNEKVTESTFERQGALLRAERTYHLEEIDRQEAALSTMENSNEAINAMVNVRDRIAAKLDSATAEDRRWVLQGLATRVEVGDSVTVSIGTNQRTTSVMHSGKCKTETEYRFSFAAGPTKSR